jgi:hypothetical protein
VFKLLKKSLKKGDILKNTQSKDILNKLSLRIGDITVAGWDRTFYKYEGALTSKKLPSFLYHLRYKTVMSLGEKFSNHIYGDRRPGVILFTKTEDFDLNSTFDKAISKNNQV